MSENEINPDDLDFNVDLSPKYDRAADAPRSGGKKRKWIGENGSFLATVTRIENAGKANKGQGNQMVHIALDIDEPDLKGTEVELRYLPVEGEVKKGDNAGQPNINRFIRFLDSKYSFEHGSDDAGAAETQKLLGKSPKMSKLKEALIGAKVAVRCRTDYWQSSKDPSKSGYQVEVKAAVLHDEYQALVAGGNNRYPISNEAKAWYEALRASKSSRRAEGSGGGVSVSSSEDGGADDVLAAFDDVA